MDAADNKMYHIGPNKHRHAYKTIFTNSAMDLFLFKPWWLDLPMKSSHMQYVHELQA